MSDRDELIAKAREIMRVCPDSCTLLPALADLAESDGRRAATLAQENARLINEVGELHAKHAAPVVDITKGGVLHIPILPINEQADADLAAILAEHDRKKTRTPL